MTGLSGFIWGDCRFKPEGPDRALPAAAIARRIGPRTTMDTEIRAFAD